MRFKEIKAICLCVFVFLFLINCKKKQNENQPDYSASINEFVKSAPMPIQPIGSDTAIIGTPTNITDGSYFCNEKKISFGYSLTQQYIVNTQSTGVYPGNLLDGNSVIEGTFKSISVNQAPFVLTIALDNLKGLNTKDVQNPDPLSVKAAIQSLQSQGVYSSAPSNMSFDYFDVSSAEVLANAIGVSSATLHLAAGEGSLESKLKESLEYGSPINKNKFIFRYTQAFYSVEVSNPATPSAYFSNSVSTQQLGEAMKSYTMPMYVSKVNYGRVIYFCVESDNTFDVIKKDWEESISNVIGKGKVLVDQNFDLLNKVNSSPLLKNCTISSVVISGSLTNGAPLINKMNLPTTSTFIKTGSNYDNSASGLPISFEVKKLSDNTIFKIVNYNEYVVRSCASNKSTVIINDFSQIAGDNTLVGTITVTLGYSDTGLTSQKITVWNNGDGSPIDLNATSPIAANYTLAYLTIDPLRRSKAYLKIETSFYDKDFGELENPDYYNGETVYYNFNGNNSNLITNNNGGYSLTVLSTVDNYSEWQKCCGLCVDKCRVVKSKSQNSSFKFNFQIQ